MALYPGVARKSSDVAANFGVVDNTTAIATVTPIRVDTAIHSQLLRRKCR